jgi:SAM-dependent methyltransferase
MDKLLLAKARAKFSKASAMRFDGEGLEISSPETLSLYRASRFAGCAKALDLGCGIGGDTIGLASKIPKVVAVELNPVRLDFARKNCEAYGLKDVEFAQGDYTKLDLKKFGADCAFADPSRRAGSERKNALEETTPPVPKVVDMLSKLGLKGFAVECPTRLSPSDVPWDCEKEYASLRGELISLTLYFGALKKADVSAVSLPAGARLEGAPSAAPEETDLKEFFFEPDEAVVSAGLFNRLAVSLGLDAWRGFLTSEKLAESPFFRNRFKVVQRGVSAKNVLAALRNSGAGKVVIRGSMDPDEQVRLKRSLEEDLVGKKKFHWFADEEVLAENADF